MSDKNKMDKANYKYLVLKYFNVHEYFNGSWDKCVANGYVDDYEITDKGRAYVEAQLADPANMPMTMKRVLLENDTIRPQVAHLFTHDPNRAIRVNAIGVKALEPASVPDSPDGLRTDMVYAFSDLDRFCTPTWLWRHMVANTYGDHYVYDADFKAIRALSDLEFKRKAARFRYASETFFAE